MTGREAILARVRAALATRETTKHPGPFEGPRPAPLPADPITGFVEVFERSGGEVVRVAGTVEAAGVLRGLATEPTSGTRREGAHPSLGLSTGSGVPADLVDWASAAPPETASIGVSVARGAVAETGSLILDARDGRRTQLLPPTHVVLLNPRTVHRTLVEALEGLQPDLPSAIGLHSGPSKSADIGQILVKGVHGPGRVIALLMEES